MMNRHQLMMGSTPAMTEHLVLGCDLSIFGQGPPTVTPADQARWGSLGALSVVDNFRAGRHLACAEAYTDQLDGCDIHDTTPADYQRANRAAERCIPPLTNPSPELNGEMNGTW